MAGQKTVSDVVDSAVAPTLRALDHTVGGRMTAPKTGAPEPADPVVEHLSAYVIAGRVKAQPSPESETAARTPAHGVDDGAQADRIGFQRVFLSERCNLKEAGALLGGIAARTTRIGRGACRA